MVSASTPPYTAAAALAREAVIIAKNAPYSAHDMAPLLVLTDPARLPDPVHLATYLPKACAIVYRHFGAPNTAQVCDETQKICARRGLSCLVSYEPQIVQNMETGVHFPERHHYAISTLRAAQPKRPITAAAHSIAAANFALASGANAVLLSPVFESMSPSANTFLGVENFARMCAKIEGPVYALGGITAGNAHLLRAHAAGLAVIGGVL